MMKTMRKIAVLAMTVCLIIGTMAVGVFADYEYSMTVSGGRGDIKGAPEKITSAEAVTTDPDSNKVIINGEEYTVTPPDKNHFVIGLKDAGHDNSELLDMEVKLSDRNEDTDLIVAYGLKSDMVEYTINYVDAETGEDLLDPETHYGVDGSKPVVSYKYVADHLPDAYNRTGTIRRGEANEFTFYYYEVDVEGNVITRVVGGGGAAGAGAAGAGAAGAPGAAADGANIGDGAVPLVDGQPQQEVDIDDNNTPLIEGDTNGDGVVDENDIQEGETPEAEPGSGLKAGPIAAGAAIVAAIAAAAVALVRRNRKNEEADEDGSEE